MKNNISDSESSKVSVKKQIFNESFVKDANIAKFLRQISSSTFFGFSCLVLNLARHIRGLETILKELPNYLDLLKEMVWVSQEVINNVEETLPLLRAVRIILVNNFDQKETFSGITFILTKIVEAAKDFANQNEIFLENKIIANEVDLSYILPVEENYFKAELENIDGLEKNDKGFNQKQEKTRNSDLLRACNQECLKILKIIDSNFKPKKVVKMEDVLSLEKSSTLKNLKDKKTIAQEVRESLEKEFKISKEKIINNTTFQTSDEHTKIHYKNKKINAV